MVAYTNINVALVCGAVALRKRALYPALFANSLAVLLSFHAGLALDPTARARVLAWAGYGPKEFAAYDFFGHVLPMLVLGAITPTPRRNPGWASLAMHAAWLGCHHRQNAALLDMSHVYVPMDVAHWRAMWLVAAAAHLTAIPSLRAARALLAWVHRRPAWLTDDLL